MWLELTPSASITRLDMTAGSAADAVGAEIRIPVPSPRSWSPQSPFPYDLRVWLRSGTSTVDQLTSYFGMRSTGALKFDIQKHKDLGFNLLRKHIKVEPQRWYSAALTSRYLGLVQGLQRLMVSPGLSASVYTELTDVEGEINGFFTYDRAILKVDLNPVRTAHLNLLAASRQLNNQGPLPTGQFRSLQVTTPNLTNRYLRHFESLGFTEVVDGNSSATLNVDSTWNVASPWAP